MHKLSESTPLISKGRYAIERLGIDSREVWSIIIIVLLFIGKGVQPFVTDIVHVTQAALIEDKTLDITFTALGGLVGVQDFTSGVAKLSVPIVLRNFGPRIVYLTVLFVGACNTLAIASIEGDVSITVIFSGTVLQSFVHSWLYPATTMTICGWMDGSVLGRSIGIVAVATKITPIFMALIYGHLLDVGTWRTCYYFASILFASIFVVFFVFMRSSATSVGFRMPAQPTSGKKGNKRGGEDGPVTAPNRPPPLGNEPSSLRALYIISCMRRTWALLLGFTCLVLLKGSAKFASLYAKQKLGVTASQGTTLFTTYAVASVVSGLCGGFVYDAVPEGKVGIGVLMTSLNLLNLSGFIYALVLEQMDFVTMPLLQVYMFIVGFASVLPVSLPFQIYAMGMGGVEHCGMIVAAFECFALIVESLFDVVIGCLLDQKNFSVWLSLNIVFATLGTAFMALFYILDYRKSPKANVLTSVPR